MSRRRPAIIIEPCQRVVDGFGKALNGHAFTYNAGGKGQHLVGIAARALGKRLAGAARIRQARRARAGIGISGVDQQVARCPAPQVLTRHQHRRRAEGIAGEHRRRAGS